MAKKKRTTGKAPRKKPTPANVTAPPPPVAPDQMERIGVLWLQQWSVPRISAVLGVTDATVRYHLENSILPVWQNAMLRNVEIELARVDLIERIAWEQFESSQGTETTESVKTRLAKEDSLDGELIERAVTKTKRLTGQPAWIAVVQWCVDWRSKIAGYYAAKGIDVSGTIRVAGKSREEIEEELQRRIAFVVERLEQRKQLANLGAGRN